MDGKTIQCLSNTSQHVPICLEQFPSYSNCKCKKSPFSRTAAHIFVSPGDAPAIITQYVAWMERQVKDKTESSRWNSATPFGTEKLEWLGYHMVKKFRRYLYSFWRNSRT